MVLSSWQSRCESSPGLFDDCRMAPSGRRPKTKPDDLGCESACTGCQNLHPPLPFIIITYPESWYSFYRPTEGRRLSRPSWLVTYRDGLPVHRWSPVLVLTGSDVAQLRWSRPTYCCVTVHCVCSVLCVLLIRIVGRVARADDVHGCPSLVFVWSPRPSSQFSHLSEYVEFTGALCEASANIFVH